MNLYIKLLIILLTLFLCSCALSPGAKKASHIDALLQKAEAGHLESQYRLGLHYTVNGKTGQDYSHGYDWLLSAADRGHRDAQYLVGMDKLFGRGTDIDRSGAVRYFLMAAKTGHARAQYQVGDAFINGAGTEKDQPWGRHWLEQAAWNDHRYAQFLLAALFSAGIGGGSNNVEAWVWAKQASQNDLERADTALQQLEGKMSEKELAEGKSLLTRESASDGELYRIPRIRYIQTILKQHGHDAGAEDGIVGPKTSSAIAEFLVENDLSPQTSMSELIDLLRKSY